MIQLQHGILPQMNGGATPNELQVQEQKEQLRQNLLEEDLQDGIRGDDILYGGSDHQVRDGVGVGGGVGGGGGEMQQSLLGKNDYYNRHFSGNSQIVNHQQQQQQQHYQQQQQQQQYQQQQNSPNDLRSKSQWQLQQTRQQQIQPQPQSPQQLQLQQQQQIQAQQIQIQNQKDFQQRLQYQEEMQLQNPQLLTNTNSNTNTNNLKSIGDEIVRISQALRGNFHFNNNNNGDTHPKNSDTTTTSSTTTSTLNNGLRTTPGIPKLNQIAQMQQRTTRLYEQNVPYAPPKSSYLPLIQTNVHTIKSLNCALYGGPSNVNTFDGANTGDNAAGNGKTNDGNNGNNNDNNGNNNDGEDDNDEDDNSSGSSTGGDVVYWRNIPSDAKYQSPYYRTVESSGYYQNDPNSNHKIAPQNHDSQQQHTKQQHNRRRRRRRGRRRSSIERYLTFEPDLAGWNNKRMGFETVLVLSAAMGRTRELPLLVFFLWVVDCVYVVL